MRIASIVGARPNFVKLAPVHKAISNYIEHKIIHTGQHYDFELSEIFFREFNLPKPDFNLNVGSAASASQIGRMLIGLNDILKDNFDKIIVYGDTNSTIAGALCGIKLGIKVIHVEAGLRSFDRTMPEEINRIITDQLSDFLLAPTYTAIENLRLERIHGKVINAGDLSVEILRDATALSKGSSILKTLELQKQSYLLFTMHRAENTISYEALFSIIEALEELDEFQIVFPIHPRTKNALKDFNLLQRLNQCMNVKVIDPVGYIDFVKLMQGAQKIITDSGGVQKEAYILGVPCITIRKNTEWVETVEQGWNVLVDVNKTKIINAVKHWMPKNEERKPIFGTGDTSLKIRRLLAEDVLVD